MNPNPYDDNAFLAEWAAYEEGRRQRRAGLPMSPDAFRYEEFPGLRPAYERGWTEADDDDNDQRLEEAGCTPEWFNEPLR